MSCNDDFFESNLPQEVTHSIDLRHCVIKNAESEEQSEIGKQGIHGQGRIPLPGEMMWEGMLGLIQEVTQDPMEAKNTQCLFNRPLKS